MMGEGNPIGGLILGLLLVVNVATIYQFWADKRAAERAARRTPKATLLFWAFIGGSPGAFLARRWFRHKTRKEPFSTYLWVIVAVQIGALIGVLVV